jgi:Flp pilus assembly secretin CpaC
MLAPRGIRAALLGVAAVGCAVCSIAATARAQEHVQEDVVTPIDMSVGRSLPLTVSAPITKVAVANPDIADVVVISTVELVINARAPGETDAIIWQEGGARKHYRLTVKSTSEHKQIIVSIKFAEVDRNVLRTISTSAQYEDANNLVGTNNFSTGVTNPISIASGEFISVLTNFDTQKLLGLLQAQEQKGRSRTLAEPTVMAGNKEPADFLAGGEVPIPVVQTGGSAATSGGAPVTIAYKEYGVKLHFVAEILSDTLIQLQLTPEVSTLDYTNAITLSGFKIPALSTRKVQSTVDVRRGESLILSGMFNDSWSKDKTGIPLLMNIPILGDLFSSTQWQHNQTELLVVVTPIVIDPLSPRPQDILQLRPDTTLPARDAIKHLLPPVRPQGTPPPR